MMIILPPQHINMTRHPRRKRPTPQPMLHHLRIQTAHHGPLEAKLPDKEGPRTDIHHCATQRFVEGRVGVSVAGDARAWAESGLEAAPEGDEGVFCGVVVVDRQITVAADEEGPPGVFGPGVQHVVEEADAGPDPDVLGAGELGCVVGLVLQGYGVGVLLEDGGLGREGGEGPAVEGEGDLDVGFVGFAFLGGCPRGGRGGRHGWRGGLVGSRSGMIVELD